jgi:hypothetical protein
MPMSGRAPTFRPPTRRAYLAGMIAAVRLARVLALLFLAFLAVTLVIGIGTSETGVIEKAVLLVLVAGCVFLAAKVSKFATRTEGRLHRH